MKKISAKLKHELYVNVKAQCEQFAKAVVNAGDYDPDDLYDSIEGVLADVRLFEVKG